VLSERTRVGRRFRVLRSSSRVKFTQSLRISPARYSPVDRAGPQPASVETSGFSHAFEVHSYPFATVPVFAVLRI
jgi:hypothetical protein